MSAETAAVVLSFILTLFALRRVIKFTMKMSEQMIRIEEDVSSYKAFTMELRMNDREHAAYSKIHDLYADSLFKRSNNKDVRMLSIAHRALCSATFDANLQQFEDRTIGKNPGNPAWAG